MRTVHVVTHPEASHHVDGLVGGWFESELTPRGHADAVRISRALRARIPPDGDVALVTSDLTRAIQTAEPVAAALGVVAAPDPDLREKSYGEAEGRARAWLEQRFVPPPAGGDRLDHDEGIAGAETRAELARRVYAGLDRALATPAEHVVIITHGFAATFVIAAWIGVPLDSAGYVSFRSSPGGITELHQDDRFHNRQVAVLDDTTHLAG